MSFYRSIFYRSINAFKGGSKTIPVTVNTSDKVNKEFKKGFYLM